MKCSIFSLILAATSLFACKPVERSLSDTESMKISPVLTQNKSVRSLLSVYLMSNREIDEMMGELQGGGNKRITLLPNDFRDWLLALPEDKKTRQYEYEIMRETFTKWNKPHECWYILKTSKAAGKSAETTTLLTRGIVSVDEAFNKSREFFDSEKEPAPLTAVEYTNNAAHLKSGQLYACLSGSNVKCKMPGTSFAAFFFGYYLPAAIEKSQKSWSRCPEK